MNTSVFSSDFKDSSYWLEDTKASPELTESLPGQVDVLIIGSGYTGLNAAIQTARAGRSTLVVDASFPGWGCSTRNGGQISTSIKPSLQQLSRKYGYELAIKIRREGENALQWIEEFVTEEGIECDFLRAGRFHAAHTPEHFNGLCKDAKILKDEEGVEVYPVERENQRSELGTDMYYGGVVFPNHCSLHPAKYHQGLLRTALNAGSTVVPYCAATRIQHTSEGFKVETKKGVVMAKKVAIATNGYTGSLTPWLQRRVIPIGSYVIATEPLPKELVCKLFPTNRIASDSCKVVYYYRASPDGTRILFGGRVSASETDATISGPKLHKDMCDVFPELNDYRISHSWAGQVAYTFDEIAHTGQHKGIYYAMGYCGSGVSMASYLGCKLGLKMLDLIDGESPLDQLKHPTRPFYNGKPWFLPAVVSWYRWQDNLQKKKAGKNY